MYKAEFDFEILFVAFCGMTYDVSWALLEARKNPILQGLAGLRVVMGPQDRSLYLGAVLVLVPLSWLYF